MALLLRRHARARVSLHGLLTSCLLLASVPASGCEDASGAPTPDSAQRFGVGTAAYEWRDASRAELATPEPGDVRRIRARAWYPASADASARAPYFLSPLQAELNAQAVGLAPDTFASVTLPAQADAPLAAGSFPVLIYSPGMSTAPEFYGYQLAELASRGYVVFALAHTHATGSVVFADGSIAHELPEPPGDGVRDRSIEQWSLDQRFVLSQVAELAQPASGDRLAGHVDPTRAGVLGHSRGGAAAAQSCQLDPRFVACANLDGSVGTALLPAAIAQPFLLLRSELEESTLRGFFDEVAGPIHRVEIAGAGHNSFTDLPRLVRDLSLPLDPEGLLLGSLGAERAFEINASFVAGFFDAELREGSSALFLEPSPFAEVTLTNRMPAVAEK